MTLKIDLLMTSQGLLQTILRALRIKQKNMIPGVEVEAGELVEAEEAEAHESDSRL